MMNEKRIVIEFMETGGFINLEHDSLMLNMRLYRTTWFTWRSNIILLMGLLLAIMSVYNIQIEHEAAMRLKEAEKDGEGGGDQAAEGEKKPEEAKEVKEDVEAGKDKGAAKAKQDDKRQEFIDKIKVILACDGFDKVGFLNILLAFTS